MFPLYSYSINPTRIKREIYTIYIYIVRTKGHSYNILINILINREAKDMPNIYEKTSLQDDSNLNLHMAS